MTWQRCGTSSLSPLRFGIDSSVRQSRPSITIAVAWRKFLTIDSAHSNPVEVDCRHILSCIYILSIIAVLPPICIFRMPFFVRIGLVEHMEVGLLNYRLRMLCIS